MNTCNQHPQDSNQCGSSGISPSSEQPPPFNALQRESGTETNARQNADIYHLRSLLFQADEDKDKYKKEAKKLRELLAKLYIQYLETNKHNQVIMNFCSELLGNPGLVAEQARRNGIKSDATNQAAVTTEQSWTLRIDDPDGSESSSLLKQVDHHDGSVMDLAKQSGGSNESHDSVNQVQQGHTLDNYTKDDSKLDNQQVVQAIYHSQAAHSTSGMITNEEFDSAYPANTCPVLKLVIVRDGQGGYVIR